MTADDEDAPEAAPPESPPAASPRSPMRQRATKVRWPEKAPPARLSRLAGAGGSDPYDEMSNDVLTLAKELGTTEGVNTAL